jgi:hypothetical protein
MLRWEIVQKPQVGEGFGKLSWWKILEGSISGRFKNLMTLKMFYEIV